MEASVKYVIVVNPQANQVRKNPDMIREILNRFTRYAQIIQSSTVDLLHRELSKIRLEADFSKVTLCIVGGDGTFKQMLDWVIDLPEMERPILMPVGGGQFNFMTRHVGFTSGNPIRNLSKLFRYQKSFEPRIWQPVAVHDSLSNSRHHGAVVANGIVCEFTELYERDGKGDMAGVTRLVGAVILGQLKTLVSDSRGYVNHTLGKLSVDQHTVAPSNEASIVIGAVNQFLPFCHPFREKIEADRCAVIAYWGSLTALALSIPPFWTGSISPLTDLNVCNTNADLIVLSTKDARMTIDGDFFHWPTPKDSNPERTFTIKRGPGVALLYRT